jgi:hypothetical protein
MEHRKKEEKGRKRKAPRVSSNKGEGRRKTLHLQKYPF